MKQEFHKLLRQWPLLLTATAVLAALYVSLAFTGNFDTFGGHNLSYYRENEDYRSYYQSRQPEKVDEAWIESKKAAYRAFVDENLLTREEIAERIAYYEDPRSPEELLADRYSYDNFYLVLSREAIASREMEYGFYEAFRIYIPLAEDPVEYYRNSITIRGYSESRQKDFLKRVGRIYRDWTPTAGSGVGWDVCCAVMRYLPQTLGTVLILVLGNLFSQERSAGMNELLRTARNGRGKLLRKKLGLALLLTTALWLFFQLAMLLLVSQTYTLQGARCTAVSYMRTTTYFGLSWGQYYLVQSLFSYFGTLCFALLVCVFSSLLRPRLAFPIQLALTLLAGLSIDKIGAFQVWERLRVLLPAQLMQALTTARSYQSYRLGFCLVPLPLMSAAALVIECAVMLLFLKKREGE